MSDEAVYELKVLEGKDAGKVIPLQGPSITLGRSGAGLAVTPGSIQFEEASVARIHAVLHWSAEENVYHLSNRSPISPCMLDGTPVAKAPLSPGARIQLGQLVAEVRATGKVEVKVAERATPVMPPSESGFLGEAPDQPSGPPPAWLLRGGPRTAEPEEEAPAKARKAPARKKKEEEEAPPPPKAAPPPPRPPEPAKAPEEILMGFLELVKGGGAKGTRFPVYCKTTTMGRSPDCDVPVEENRVSRHHASIVWEGDLPILVHESGTNSTKVGRTKVTDRHTLTADDEITLADKVVLRWEPEK